jgi:hypothetical protein
MAWLTSLLKKPEVEAPAEDLEPELPPAPSGPQLAVLVPDIAGISSFRLQLVPDAHTGEEYVAGLRAEVRHDTHAFWALHERPVIDASMHVEALVLIRSQPDSDLVYVVSFLDIESALSFTRFEVRRGLHLGNVMIFWAAFAQVREELEGVTITPEFAPPTENYVPPAIHTEPPPAPQQAASVAVAEPEPEVIPQPEVESAVEAAAREAVQRYLEKHDNQPTVPAVENSAAVAEPPVIEKAPVIEERPVVIEPPVVERPAVEERLQAPEPPAVIQQPAVDQTVPFEERSISLAPEFSANLELDEEATPVIEDSVTTVIEEPLTVEEPDLSSPVAEEQAAIDEAIVFQHRAVELRPNKHMRNALEIEGEAGGMLVGEEEERLEQFEGAVEAFTGDEEATDSAMATLTIGAPEPATETFPGDEEAERERSAASTQNPDPASGLPQTPKADEFDIAYEVERLLRHRRWEQRTSPFSGFDSPPGKF